MRFYERWAVYSFLEELRRGGPVTKIVDWCRHTVTAVGARCQASPCPAHGQRAQKSLGRRQGQDRGMPKKSVKFPSSTFTLWIYQSHMPLLFMVTPSPFQQPFSV